MQTGPDMTQTLERLRTTRHRKRVDHQRAERENPPRAQPREDITIAGLVHRRKRCRRCRYEFQYLMRGAVCPECGVLRDDYPEPSLSIKTFAAACGVGTLLSFVGIWVMFVVTTV